MTSLMCINSTCGNSY